MTDSSQGGGVEEVWRSLAAIEYFDLDTVTEYALLLGNATTVAEVGFFLETHRERLMVNDDHLECLRRHRPRQPHYFAHPSDGDGRLAPAGPSINPAPREKRLPILRRPSAGVD